MKHTVIAIGLTLIAAKTAAFLTTFSPKPSCFSSPSRAKGCDPLRSDPRQFGGNLCIPRSRASKPFEFHMGGYNSYYVESDSDAGSDKFKEEIGGRKINRSKTHMIFGVRCLETNHELSIAPEPSTMTATVVGLQPLSDLEEETSDGTICTQDMDQKETLTIILGHLCSKLGSNHENSFEFVEVGADPIVSLAAFQLLGADRSVGVVVYHPDEQRLRVLEHAHLYFNERKTSQASSFRTIALSAEDPLTLEEDDESLSDRVVLFTSPKLVSSRLQEAVVAGRSRVLVPSAIISAQQLEQYQYQVVAGNESDDTALLEILSAKP